MKTMSFRIFSGIEAGYGHNIAGVADIEVVNKVAALWQELAAAEFEKSGTYVAAAISPAAVVYHTEWGCPDGGESVVILSGTANPQFVKDLKEWKRTIERLARELKKALNQSTLSVEFWESDLVYLTD